MTVEEAIQASRVFASVVHLVWTADHETELLARSVDFSDEKATQIEFWGADWRITLVDVPEDHP